jgi:uncharacterized protein
MKFAIACTTPLYNGKGDFIKAEDAFFVYDNQTSEIFDEQGNLVEVKPLFKQNFSNAKEVKHVSAGTPIGKTRIKTLKIQLGLSCNYSCEYCSQRFVPNIDHSNAKLVDTFLDNLDSWIEHPPEAIEFWGGEPFVYWKVLKPLAEKLRERFVFTKFLVITNGSLLTDKIIDWLDELGFVVGISHDGPGQNVRGPDPFENPKQKKMILKLVHRFLPQGRMSFNSMVHRENMDKAKIQQWFEAMLGEENKFNIGEGSFIDTYDEGGKANSILDVDEHYAFRRVTMDAISQRKIDRFLIFKHRIGEWIDSFGNYRPANVLGQKCGMDREDTIAVDLQGNVMTCQNVTAVSKAPNGNSHKIGHVSKFEEIKLNTATHWKFRKECSNCPVLQMCKGSCMFLEDEYFKISCDSAYSDHIPFFAAAFEEATGCLPYAIKAIEDGYELPKEREDLWGSNDKNYTVPETRKESIKLSDNSKPKYTVIRKIVTGKKHA